MTTYHVPLTKAQIADRKDFMRGALERLKIRATDAETIATAATSDEDDAADMDRQRKDLD